MMPETLRIILDFYWHPMKAASRALDHGRLLVALVLAIALAAVQGGPFGVFGPLAIMSLVFVPASIAILAQWKGLGSVGVALRRDYMSLLVCLLFAWVAASLPAAPLRFLPGFTLWVAVATSVYWLALAVCCIAVVMGVRLWEAAVACAAATGACVIGLVAFGFLGRYLFFLASPWFLYFGYMLLAADLRMLGAGLSNRQHFRRQLEFATLNPRDSDAHYQLGLIYQSRRQYDEAVSRFKQSIEIDPSEAGAHYQLGRIALEQGRHQEALDYFCAAAEIDEKHSSNEVWRDMGVACFHLGDIDNARRALERYVERREYDPEGLYWLGKALVAEDRKSEAIARFKQAIEAARTAPNHRRGVVRQWIGKSRAELKALG